MRITGIYIREIISQINIDVSWPIFISRQCEILGHRIIIFTCNSDRYCCRTFFAICIRNSVGERINCRLTIRQILERTCRGTCQVVEDISVRIERYFSSEICKENPWCCCRHIGTSTHTNTAIFVFNICASHDC